MYSKLIYQDPFITHSVKPVDTVFYMPFEPDANSCVGMWNMNHNGRFSIDSSGNGHFGRWTLNPEVKEGIEDGFGSSLYANFDGETNVVYIDNHAKLRLSSVPQFTITGRIYPTDISATDGPGGNKYRTILHKADTTDNTGQNSGLIDTGSVGNGYALAITPEGRLRFTLQVNGVKYTVHTLANVIVPHDPPFVYDFAVTVDQINKRTVQPVIMTDPGQNPGSGEEEEPELAPSILAPRIEIAVNLNFYALYTTAHLPFVDDGSFRRLRFGTAFTYHITGVNKSWFKYKGGMQQIKMYSGKILTLNEIQHLHENKYTITEMPLGSPALAGRALIITNAVPGAFDELAFDFDAYETISNVPEGQQGFAGFDANGFDEGGFDVLTLTDQGTLQGGGFDPKGFSQDGFDTLPESQS